MQRKPTSIICWHSWPWEGWALINKVSNISRMVSKISGGFWRQDINIFLFLPLQLCTGRAKGFWSQPLQAAGGVVRSCSDIRPLLLRSVPTALNLCTECNPDYRKHRLLRFSLRPRHRATTDILLRSHTNAMHLRTECRIITRAVIDPATQVV